APPLPGTPPPPGAPPQRHMGPEDAFATFDEETRRDFTIRRRPRLFTPDGKQLLSFWPNDPPCDPRLVPLSAAGLERSSTVEYERVPVRIFSAPIYQDGRVKAVIQFAYPLTAH